MGGRGGSSISGYNSQGNEYVNRLKSKAYAEDVRYRFKELSDKDLEYGIQQNKEGIRFNNEQMKKNLNKDNAGTMNVRLYERNKGMEQEIKDLQYEQKQRVKDKKTIGKFWDKAGFGMESKNVTINKVEGSKVEFTYMGQRGVFDTNKKK